MTSDQRQALATMVYEAIRFCDWAAGEGFAPAAGEPAMDPAELLSDYVTAIDGDDYEGLATAARDAVLTAALGDAVVVPPGATLVQRCRELLEWSKTGLLNGGKGGSVRELADEWRSKIGDIHALSVAESQVRDDAMREVIRLSEALAVTRHGRDTTNGGA